MIAPMKTEDWMWIQRKLRQKAEAERNNHKTKQNKLNYIYRCLGMISLTKLRIERYVSS
jgi:hypothetical protein